MIFLIIMFLSSVTCNASHHDKKAMIEERKGVLLSRQIVGNAIPSFQALTAWVSLQDIYNTEPTYQQLGEIRNKISTRNTPGYQVSTVILPGSEKQAHKHTVSYYKRSQNNNVSHNNAALVQALGLGLQASEAQSPAQKKEVVISGPSTSQSLIVQAMSMQMPQQAVEKPTCELPVTGSDGGLLSPIRVSRHDKSFCFQRQAHDDVGGEKEMQQLKIDIKSTHVSSRGSCLKSRCYDSDDSDSDSDSDNEC